MKRRQRDCQGFEPKQVAAARRGGLDDAESLRSRRGAAGPLRCVRPSRQIYGRERLPLYQFNGWIDFL